MVINLWFLSPPEQWFLNFSVSIPFVLEINEDIWERFCLYGLSINTYQIRS